MNIFASSKCPIQSAQALDNSRVVKMVLESAQILHTSLYFHNKSLYYTAEYTPIVIKNSKVLCSSPKTKTAYYLFGVRTYAPSHINHVIVRWARTSHGNYTWLLRHFQALCQEYTRRYGKIHKCEQYLSIFKEHANLLPTGSRTPFVNCTVYKDEPDVHVAYKKYLQDKWDNDKRTPTWDIRI